MLPLYRLAILAIASFISTTLVAAPITRIIFLGDSITEGYGVSKASAYPELIAGELQGKGHKQIKVINAGVSGSTTASAVSRLKWLLKGAPEPSLLVIALGGNDGLRGLDVKAMQQHLTEAVRYAKQQGIARVVIAGMQMPPNYGREYLRDFAAVFPAVAKAEQATLLPFLLAGVAGDAKLNQADGIHPNAAGQQKVAQTMLRTILPLLEGS